MVRTRSGIVGIAIAALAAGLPAQELTVRIGHAANVSGPAYVIGRASENGARLAIDELNAQGVTIGGRRARFELVTADDRLDAKQAAAAAQSLVDTGVSAVVGHVFSSMSIAGSKVYCGAGVPQVSPASTVPEYTHRGCRSAFRVVADDTRLGSVLGRHAVKELRAKRIAVVDDASLFGQSIAGAFATAVAAAGGRVVATQHIDDKAHDFGPVIEALLPTKPDLVFFGGTSLQAGPLIKQMRQAGLNARLMGSDAFCQPDLPMRAGDAWADGQVICALPGGAALTGAPMGRFRVDYKQRFGMDPLFTAPFAYDAVRVIADAMVRAGSSEPGALLPELAATRGYKGVTGTIGFDSNGDLLDGGVTLYGFKDRKREAVAAVN